MDYLSKMPVVQQDWDFGLNLDSTCINEGLDLFESLNLPPFEELLNIDLENLSDAWNCPEDSWSLDYKRGANMIRVHDCMWAGTCLSKDHVGRKPSQNSVTTKRNQLPSSNCSSSFNNGCGSPIRIQNRSLLINSPSKSQKKRILPAPTKVLQRPDTPQSEDELCKSSDDNELTWHKGVSDVAWQRRSETSTVISPTTVATTIANSVSFDHNYNTKKQPRIDDLGVQTPSDSDNDEEETEEEEESQSSEIENDEEQEEEEDEEEEIDVVSLKPASPHRKKISNRALQDDWSRRERQRMEEWRKQEKLRIKQEEEWQEMNQQDQVFKFASQAVSKRLSAQSESRRGRQKRKRPNSDDEEFKAETYIKANHRRTCARPRNATRKKATTSPKKTRISDSETDSTEKRSQHNNMERMRRIDLRNAFDDLRLLVPSLADSTRAAKVTILRDATSYCLQLHSNSKVLHTQVSILKKEQEKLRSNLSKLRKLIANKHLGPKS